MLYEVCKIQQLQLGCIAHGSGVDIQGA